VKTIACVIIGLASVALAEDFKTLDGKEYKDVTVRRVEPDGIVVATKSGISKLYFTELPKEVHDRFLGNYGSEQELQARYMALQQREYALLKAIGDTKRRKGNKHKAPALEQELKDVRASMKDVKTQLDALDLLRAKHALPDNASHQ